MAIRTGPLAAAFFVWAAALLVGAAALLTADDKPADNDPHWKVKPPDRTKKPVPADNSYCLVCHVNLETEDLVDGHRPAGVGCETCHGLSDKHSADEDNLTPPEIMWPKPRLNARCLTCHPRTALVESKEGGDAHQEALARWAKPETANKGERYCTDCHGDHHIPNRTRQWDKETGKLLKRTGGPVMDR